MHPDKWPEIKEKIKSSFEVFDEHFEKDEERQEEVEVIEFNGPFGKMRMEWITRPKVLGKKTSYSQRIGGDIGVDYIYSEDEVTHTFKILKWDLVQNDWEEINADSLGL